ncbi:ABC transporter substrate-binding protein [Devosia rhizoryzae]|uniref:Amino acid ABC transporter substrate-binding protein n=1 Tax=Devosia rhizoryzae TaxID=2774137 RepID=A0ABX7CDI3_9HYPH|nr:ABC transporter substrate-binding protein [Devosia rhizoryzae]QQR40016.1 amino acid ABC transporter substrate-binding protein [Devosia rhizoryzae]
MTIITRRFFLAGASAVIGASLVRPGSAVAAAPADIRIGTVFPVRTGASFIHASVNDFIGTAGRIGVQLADTQLGTRAEEAGSSLHVLLANAPTVEAAVRAGERLVEVEKVHALVGGVGEGQAEALAEIAARAKIPFFNVGETSDAFRRDASSPYLFHIEASDAMYLDALAQLAVQQGHKRWLVVSDNSDRGVALSQRAELAAQKAGCTIVETVELPAASPVYFAEIEDMAAVDADVIVVLINYQDFFTLTVQMEEEGITTPILTFPHTITQTRDFVAASRGRLSVLSPKRHVALWETTRTEFGADDFNLQVQARFSEPADPTAWASFHAIKIILEAAIAAGSTDADAMVAYLEDPQTTFDVLKGPGVSFRPWDHQLRQPLAVVDVRNDVVWREREIATRVAAAADGGTLPEGAPGDDAMQWLDTLGDGPED